MIKTVKTVEEQRERIKKYREAIQLLVNELPKAVEKCDFLMTTTLLEDISLAAGAAAEIIYQYPELLREEYEKIFDLFLRASMLKNEFDLKCKCELKEVI